MAKSPPKSWRDLQVAARDGDHGAAHQLLRQHGGAALAKEVHRGRPFSPRVRKMVNVLTAGVGTQDQLSKWEHRDENGEIRNALQPEPPLRSKVTQK